MSEEVTTSAEETTTQETTIDNSASLMGGLEDVTNTENPEVEGEQEVQTMVKPSDLPDEFWDNESGFKTDDILKAFNTEKKKAEDLRKIISKGKPEAPKTTEEYKVEIPEEYAPYVKDDDIAIAKLKTVALKHGLSNEVVNDITVGIMSELKEQGAYDNIKTPEESQAAFAEYQKGEMDKLGSEGPKIIHSIKHFIKSQVDSEVLSTGEADALLASGTNADAINALNKLRFLATGEASIPMQGVVDGVKSQEEVDAMITAVNEDGRHKMENPNYRAKVDAEIEKRRLAGF